MRESKIKPAGSATLTYKNKQYTLPAFSGTEGPEVSCGESAGQRKDLKRRDPRVQFIVYRQSEATRDIESLLGCILPLILIVSVHNEKTEGEYRRHCGSHQKPNARP